jgi:hypothetical protein
VAKKHRKLQRGATSRADIRLSSEGRKTVADASGRQNERDNRTRKVLLWVATTVVASVLGALVTLNVDAIKNWFSEREPLESHVTSADRSWSLVVPDPRRLSTSVNEVSVGKDWDCSRLYHIGLAAGGLPSGHLAHRVLLRGIAKDGSVIIDMHAKITKRMPAADGALIIGCPPQGELEPIGLTFDLTNSDSAPAQRYDKNLNKTVNQFADGFAISLAENESVSLMIETKLPSDSIDWHIEADILVGGHRRTIVIDNEGKDFYSPGTRLSNQYREGHGVDGFGGNWGVDKAAQHTKTPDGLDVLRLGPVLIPYIPYMDIYQPRNDGNNDNLYRWVRRDGRRLLTFNPPSVPPRGVPAVGDYCDLEGPYGDLSTRKSGVVRTRTLLSSKVRQHGRQQFEHWTIDYRCSWDRVRDEFYYRDGASGTDGFWKCGGVLCPEETIRVQAARMIGSDIFFVSWSNDVASQDQALAERILGSVQLSP